MEACRRKLVAFCLVLTISVGQLLGSVVNHCDCISIPLYRTYISMLSSNVLPLGWQNRSMTIMKTTIMSQRLDDPRSMSTHAFDVSPSAHDEHPPHGMIVVLAIDWYWMDSTIIFNSTLPFDCSPFVRSMLDRFLAWMGVPHASCETRQTEARSWLSSIRHGTLAPLRC